MYRIEERPDYLLVEFHHDLDTRQVGAAIREVMARDGYSGRNDLWVFDVEKIDLPYSILGDIVALVASLLPEEISGGRTALVPLRGLVGAMVDEYMLLVEHLSRPVRSFSDIGRAERWLAGRDA